MRIDLRRRKRLVTKEFLNAPQIGPVVEHVGGKTVTQRVWADVRIESRLGKILIELATDASGTKPPAVFIDEQGILIEAG